MQEKKKIPILFPPGSLMGMEPPMIITDPMGSYTGIGENQQELPVQDADDL